MRTEKEILELKKAYEIRLGYNLDNGFDLDRVTSWKSAIYILEWVLSKRKSGKK